MPPPHNAAQPLLLGIFRTQLLSPQLGAPSPSCLPVLCCAALFPSLLCPQDIFLDQAYVTNPMWVIAAPVMAEGKHLAAIIWLSSSRLSPTMLAQAAKTSVPPLLHCVAEQLQVFINQATRPSAKSGSAGVLEDGVHAWSHILNMRHIDSGHLGLSTTSIGKGIDSLMDLEHRPIKYSVCAVGVRLCGCGCWPVAKNTVLQGSCVIGVSLGFSATYTVVHTCCRLRVLGSISTVPFWLVLLSTFPPCLPGAAGVVPSTS